MDTVPAAGDVAGRADLTDAQWAILEPLLPKGTKPGRPPTWSRRQLINGVRWRTRTGTRARSRALNSPSAQAPSWASTRCGTAILSCGRRVHVRPRRRSIDVWCGRISGAAC